MNRFLQYMNETNIKCVHFYNSSYFLCFIGISLWEGGRYNGAVLFGPFLEMGYNSIDFAAKYSSQMQKMGSLKEISSFYEKLPIISYNQSQKVIGLVYNLFVNPFIEQDINSINHFKANPLKTFKIKYF